jgi:hypothetical protein
VRNFVTRNNHSPPESTVLQSDEPPILRGVESKNRRALVKKLAVGTTALAGCSVLPSKWISPLVEFGTLPAHATTSTLIAELVEKYNELNEDKEKPENEAETTDPKEEATDTENTAETTDDTAAQWTVVQWGGNPNETSESRDRTWWTKVHGEACDHWHRKFPLPQWVDDKPRRLEFVFSDGATFNVSNSTRMEMDSIGPKYKPEDPGEHDPNKQHPKIGAARGATPTWVKFREV